MNENQASYLGVPPVLPPPHFDEPAKPSTWPMALGVIAIIFGSLAALGGILGLFSPLMLGAMGQAMPTPPQGGDPFAFMKDWTGWIIAASILTTTIAGLLLAGGIGLVKRRRWAPRVVIAWAIVKIIFVAANSGMNYFFQQEQFREMIESDSPPVGMEKFMMAIGIVGLVLGVLWGWALPAFMLCWFGRKSVRSEIAQWS